MFPEVNHVGLTFQGSESQTECVFSFVKSLLEEGISLKKVEKSHFSDSSAQFSLWDFSNGTACCQKPQPGARRVQGWVG